jgi:alpha-maltose-1-phosphate synthase
MRVAHLLRKYNPAEWGGTETAIHRLFAGLRCQEVHSVVFCPDIVNGHHRDPLAEAGCDIKRFKAFVPIWGLSEPHKRQIISVGGNLMSFGLVKSLWQEPGLSVIHTHALGRLGGIALTIAKRRRLPFVVTIHGGVYALPETLKKQFETPATQGWEWGRCFGILFQARRLFVDADAIIACNPREASLLQAEHPGKRVVVHPHGVPARLYREDQKPHALAAFPQAQNRKVLLSVGRIDPVKNQSWLLEQAPEILRRQPQALLVLAGAATDDAYLAQLKRSIRQLGLENHVLLTGGLPPGDPRLIGLYQTAAAVVLPSISESFGLVILEAWAAGTPVISSRTSGAAAMIQEGQNGWLFDLNQPAGFHAALEQALQQPEQAAQFAAAGSRLVSTDYDTDVLAGRMKRLYEQVIEEKHALRHSA